jgi:hypothetical protein
MRHARLHLIALDCPGAVALATFSSALTDIPVKSWPGYDAADMPGIDFVHVAQPALSFQRVADYTPTTWPAGEHRHPEGSPIVEPLDLTPVHCATQARVLA